MTITISLPPTPNETPVFEADGEKVQQAGTTLRTSSSIFDDHGSFVGGKAKDSGLLDGRAAAAYAAALSPIGRHADACSLALRAAANAVLGHGDDLVDLEKRHQQLQSDRERLAREAAALAARADPLPTDEAELQLLKSDCDRCTSQIEAYESDLVKWAEDLRASEEKVAAALRGAMTEQQVDQTYAGVADPADAARDSMPSGKDPQAVKAWWDGLTEEQRAAMIAADPRSWGTPTASPRPTAARRTPSRSTVTSPSSAPSPRTSAPTTSRPATTTRRPQTSRATRSRGPRTR